MATLFQRDGDPRFHINFSVGGRRVRRSLHTRDEALAQLALADLENNIAKGDLDFLKTDCLVSRCVASYLDHSKRHKSPRTTELDEAVLRRFFRHVGKRRLGAITVGDIASYQSMRLEEVSRSTTHRDMQVVRATFRWAKRMGLSSADPCEKVDKLQVERFAIETITPRELELMLNSSEGRTPLFPMMAVAGFSGLRLGEIINLHWRDVDFERLDLWVRFRDDFRPKSFRERNVPMCERLATILRRHRLSSADQDGRVFRSASGRAPGRGNARRELVRMAGRLGIRCNWQILRHSFASHLVAAGVSIFKVSKFLGHASVTTTEAHYAHLAPHEHRGDLDRVFSAGPNVELAKNSA